MLVPHLAKRLPTNGARNHFLEPPLPSCGDGAGDAALGNVRGRPQGPAAPLPARTSRSLLALSVHLRQWRQLAIAIGIACLAAIAAAAWHRFNQPVGEERHGPIALCYGRPLPSCLIDGDTGRDNGKKWRLVSVDAPELSEPACENERRLAVAARDRLRELLAGGYRIRPSGRDDPNGRTLVDILLRDGRDVARILLDERLVQRWPNRGNVWCDSHTGTPAPGRE